MKTINLPNGGVVEYCTNKPAFSTPVTVTRQRFKKLLGLSVRAAIRTAQASNVTLQLLAEDIEANDEIFLGNPDVEIGLTALVDANLITADHKTKILNNEIG